MLNVQAFNLACTSLLDILYIVSLHAIPSQHALHKRQVSMVTVFCVHTLMTIKA